MLSYMELLAAAKYVKGTRLVDKITRKSEREFDVTLEGKTIEGTAYSAWLVLGLISQLPWTTDSVANMIDYPEMVKMGDWSGVRDTDEKKLWEIFDKFCHPV